MPLIYKAFQSTMKTKEGKKLYYPRLVKMDIVDTQKLGEIIAEKTSLTPGDVHNVVRNLMSAMREQLQSSRTVRLDGLGTFTMIAKAGGKGVESADKVNPGQIAHLRCRFTPEFKRPKGSATTRALTEGVTYINLADLGKTSESGGGNGGGGEIIDPTA